MQTKQLGRSDLHITTLGFGAWATGGGDWKFGWGPQNDDASVRAIHRAIDLGVNWIDTAAAYGLGHSEEVVGRAVAALPSSKRPLVFTKCSLVWDDQRVLTHNVRRESIRREVEGSLKRLGTTIDLYQMHFPKWPSSPADHDPGRYEEGWETMAALQREGKVRHIGASNFNVEQLEAAEGIAPIVSLQPPYSLLRRDIEQAVLPWCEAHGVGVISYSPMLSGMLTGRMTRERIANFPPDDWRRNNPNYKEPNLSRNLEIAGKLGEIGARHGRSAGEAAIAWVLRNPAITGAIVGARDPGQVDGVIGAAAFRLSPAEVQEVEAFVATV